MKPLFPFVILVVASVSIGGGECRAAQDAKDSNADDFPKLDSTSDFLDFGKAMLEFVANYHDTIHDRQTVSLVPPGYMDNLIPSQAPEEGEHWTDVMKDIDRVIMPGITHFHSPHFHAYYMTSNTWPSVVADILATGLSVQGYSWFSSPALTELEIITMDWLAKATDLPEHFMHNASNEVGGGVIQGSASESNFIALLAARNVITKKFESTPHFHVGKLVAYTSDQAHGSVMKAARLGAVQLRVLESNDSFQFSVATLREAIEKDLSEGLIPFMVTATLGTSATCAFDPIDEIGDLCKEKGLWLHVDAAYAGTAFVCEEYRHHKRGLEKADSYVFNPYKMMLVSYDLAALYFKTAKQVENALWMDAYYLKYDQEGVKPDFRNWQISLPRRFRALKLWFVLRIYGLEKIRKHVRSHIRLAQEFKEIVEKDDRFEIVAEPYMSLVCFVVKGASNEENEALLRRIVQRGNIFMVPVTLKGRFVIRFSIASRLTRSPDLKYAWNEILEAGKDIGLLN